MRGCGKRPHPSHLSWDFSDAYTAASLRCLFLWRTRKSTRKRLVERREPLARSDSSAIRRHPPESILSRKSFLPALGISIWLIELSFPIFIWPRKTRLLWLTLICLLHFGIGYAMGMPLFALVMIVLNVAAFGPAYDRRFPLDEERLGLR